MNVKDVAASLHVSEREVLRMAERRILPATRVKGAWQFRAGEVWNWIEANLHCLPTERAKGKPQPTGGDLLVCESLKECAVAVDLVAKTKSSVIRSLARLAELADPTLDAGILANALLERETQGSTALQDGVAVPHPSRPMYSESPVLAAARTCQGIVFGERRGGLTDLFFLVCCPTQTDHLLYLGRLCRFLLDPGLRESLRSASDASEFLDAIRLAETALCNPH